MKLADSTTKQTLQNLTVPSFATECQVLMMKVSEILRLLNEDGWYLIAQRGNHRQLKHPSKPGRVTVSGKPGTDLAPGTLNSILKQSGLKK